MFGSAGAVGFAALAGLVGFFGSAGESTNFGIYSFTASGNPSFGGKREIGYQNINRVSYAFNGLFASVFKSGTITIELNGLDKTKAVLRFIDTPDAVVQQILMLVQRARNTQQAQYAQQQRFDSIMNKF